MPAATASLPKDLATSEMTALNMTTKSFDQLDITKQEEEKSSKEKLTDSPDEGVEVVLGNSGADTDQVVDSELARETPDQNVFRGPNPRYPRGPPPPPYSVPGSGSFTGYGRPPYDRPRRPDASPLHNPSFEEGAPYHTLVPAHYSPHVQYSHGAPRYPGEDYNVISPSHKSTASGRGKSPSSHYQYPPTSPVNGGSRTAASTCRQNSVDLSYSESQQGSESHPEDGTWNAYPALSQTADGDRPPQPPIVNESSFDSDHFSNSHYSAGAHPSHPPVPGNRAPHHDPTQQFYGAPGSWGSFGGAAMSYDDGYGRLHRSPSHHYPPEYSPYSPRAHHLSPGSYPHYSPGGYYAPEQYSHPGYYPPQSYEESEMLKDYHPNQDGQEASTTKKKIDQSKAASGMVLPDAAHEVDFDVVDPPAEPVCPPSTEPLVESLAEVNGYDVLCGRGGGTNSQVGNKRFRKLVQDFQPTYLLARRKEKPLLARSIVLIIRKRGGRFLRKDEGTGMLYEVGDEKAEAKTSQALREGLDVRATRASQNGNKKKKKSVNNDSTATHGAAATVSPKTETPVSPDSTRSEGGKGSSRTGTPERPVSSSVDASSPASKDLDSPLALPKLADEVVKVGMVHPHSPEDMQFRKRRRMRSFACGADKFFPDFCPPRAEIGRGPNDPADDDEILDDVKSGGPRRRGSSIDDSDANGSATKAPVAGCTGAVMDIVVGAVAGGLCFGPKE